MRLEIRSTWDGQPAESGEWVVLTLTAHADALHITVDAPLHGDPPPPGPPGPCWALWEHEVVELFIVGADDTYTEVELSPHGHHLLLRLSSVRQIAERMLPLDFHADASGGRWSGSARLPWALIPPAPHRLNAFAIHGRGADRRYLAAFPVPGEAPDFHRIHLFPTHTLPAV
ncbi:MAG: hypothetical protein ACI8RZ_004050 [Myxococcota bacterium]|jgi:hypothetical protein